MGITSAIKRKIIVYLGRNKPTAMPARKNIIIVIEPGRNPQPWGNLKLYCTHAGWNYNSVAKYKFPFTKDGVTVYRELFHSGKKEV